MRIDILTLFPEMCETVMSESIIGRAQKSGKVEIVCTNIRDFSGNKHNKVDDTPYGGGMGMIMAASPIYNCYTAVVGDKNTSDTKVIYMSPQGKVLTQSKAKELSNYDRLVILCGHYEGIDERIIDLIVDEEISIGDYVLTGGELPACILADAVGRLIPGVLPEAECHEKESFENDLLEYPQYTRPIEFEGLKVPDVLLSGHHKNIEAWRLEKAEEITAERRPDMFEKYDKRKQEAISARLAKKRRRKPKATSATAENNEENK